MKKLKLCAGCDEWFSCQKTCQSAIDFEKVDNSSNYDHTKYQPKGVSLNWSDMRGSGGINRF